MIDVLCNFVLGYDAFHSDVQVTKTDVQYMHKTDTRSWKLKQKATKPLAMFHHLSTRPNTVKGQGTQNRISLNHLLQPNQISRLLNPRCVKGYRFS